MIAPELPLLLAASALASAAALRFVPGAETSWRTALALVIATLGALTPLLFYPLIDPARAGGRGLWDWSAVGGPTVQAAYRFDGIAAVAIAVGTAYAAAALLGIGRLVRRPPVLPSLVLAIGLTFIGIVVADDLIAATVALGVLAVLTVLALLIVAPPPATARIAAYFALGIQALVISALLVSRFGGASYRFVDILPGAISPGVIAAASVGAALFAGLYPFVPWRFSRPAARPSEGEALRGLVAMPAGIGATLVLLRLLGATRIDITEIGVPRVPLELRLVMAAVVAAIALGLVLRSRPLPMRPVLVAGALLVAIVIYPLLHWSHLVLIAAILTTVYAATVSLGLPDEWDVVRYDVALAALWVGLALGTPVALAAALALLAGDAVGSLAESIWMPPHRAYIVLVASSTIVVGGLLGIGIGALSAPDLPARALALVALLFILALELAHIGRRLGLALVPAELDMASVTAAFLGAILLAILMATPLVEGVAISLGRPFGGLSAAPLSVTAVAVVATLLVVMARAAQPFLPDLERFAGRVRGYVRLFDPVPAGIGTFRLLEVTAVRSSAAFNLFERRAGAWLATLLIVAVLVWSVR
ncbi:MAG: hypothetical protein ACRDGE_00135 [Candidatus Limnocylindria bacterium]